MRRRRTLAQVCLLLACHAALSAEEPTLEHTATVTAGNSVEFHLTTLASSHLTVRGLPKAFEETDYALGAATLDDGNVVMERYVAFLATTVGVYPFTLDLTDDVGRIIKSIPFEVTVTPRYIEHVAPGDGLGLPPPPTNNFLESP